MPIELEYLWKLFTKLNRKRQSGMGPGPLSSDEVLKWCARQRVSFEPYEHDILDRLDDLYLSHQYKKDK